MGENEQPKGWVKLLLSFTLARKTMASVQVILALRHSLKLLLPCFLFEPGGFSLMVRKHKHKQIYQSRQHKASAGKRGDLRTRTTNYGVLRPKQTQAGRAGRGHSKS